MNREVRYYIKSSENTQQARSNEDTESKFVQQLRKDIQEYDITNALVTR